jgi:hypothetical protein
LLRQSWTSCCYGSWAWPASITGNTRPSSPAATCRTYAAFLAVDFLTAALAFALEGKEDKPLLIDLLWQRFCCRQVMYYVAIKSALASVKGAPVLWGKLEWKATVKA